MLLPAKSRRVCRRDRQTDGQTDGRQTVTLRFPLDAASIINNKQTVENTVVRPPTKIVAGARPQEPVWIDDLLTTLLGSIHFPHHCIPDSVPANGVITSSECKRRGR